MLRLQQLTTGYGKKVVSSQLCATLPTASLTVLMGTNGAGKSTLLRTLAGFISPLNGNILYGTKDITHLNPRELAKTLSVVLTFRPEADALTAKQVVEMGRMPYAQFFTRNTAVDTQAVEQALQLTQTQGLAHRYINTLSDGERQRVFIAKALAQDTPIILLDEPTAFLDFPTKVHTLKLLSYLAHSKGKSILLSTHDVELALRFADNLWLLNSSGIVSGTPSLLSSEGAIAQFFARDGLHYNHSQMRFEF